MPSEICPKCQKPVYAAEKKIAGGKSWHKMCLKCGVCNKMLDSTTVAEHEGEVFCKQCHGRKYGPKGYGFGGGAGALSMDSGAHVGNTGTEMSNKPTAGVVGGAVVPPEQGGCPRCGKRVYDAEKAIGSPAGKKPAVTRQEKESGTTLQACYGKKHGPKGFGFGQGAGALNMG